MTPFDHAGTGFNAASAFDGAVAVHLLTLLGVGG